MRTIELENVENVRDLGGIPVGEGRVVQSGLFYRGSALSAPTQADVDELFVKRGVCCVVDLRCGWELAAKPNQVPDGVDYLHIPYYDLEKVGIEYTERAEGTKAVGPDFACEPTHFYRSLSNRLTTAQMRKALDEIFARVQDGRAVYFHCSGGKDRAGILSVLVLSVLGASRDDILDDYLLTNVSRDKRYDEMFARFLRLSDGDEKRAHELVVSHRAEPENIAAFYAAIDGEYGSWDAFMRETLGMTDDRVRAIREACTVSLAREASAISSARGTRSTSAIRVTRTAGSTHVADAVGTVCEACAISA